MAVGIHTIQTRITLKFDCIVYTQSRKRLDEDAIKDRVIPILIPKIKQVEDEIAGLRFKEYDWHFKSVPFMKRWFSGKGKNDG